MASSDDGAVIVVPLSLAKGLEFDAVILPDVSVSAYFRPEDRRALYTACTRPLHDLTLICAGEPSPFLPPPVSAGEEAAPLCEEIAALPTVTEAPAKPQPRADELLLLLDLRPERQKRIAEQLCTGWERIPASAAKAAKDLHTCIQRVPIRPNALALFTLLEGRYATPGISRVAATLVTTGLWRLTQPELEARAAAYLTGRAIPAQKAGKLVYGTTRYTEAQLRAWAADLDPALPPDSAASDALALMFAALTAGLEPVNVTVPETAEPAPEATTMKRAPAAGTPDPEALLAPWRELPADADAWGGVEVFLERFTQGLRALAGEKRREREAAAAARNAERRAREEVEALLASLRERFGPLVSEFRADEWAADALPSEDLAGTALRLTSLCDDLEAFVGIDITAASWTDRPALLTRQGELSLRIPQHARALAAELTR